MATAKEGRAGVKPKVATVADRPPTRVTTPEEFEAALRWARSLKGPKPGPFDPGRAIRRMRDEG